MTFTLRQIAASIGRALPGFEVHHAPDYRQAIMHAWPESIDDSTARSDWGWRAEYGLDAMVADMLAHLRLAVAA